MRTRTKAKPAALLLLALFVAILLAVHGMPSVGSGTAGGSAPWTDPAAPSTAGGASTGEVPAALGSGFGLAPASAGEGLPFTVSGGVTGLAPGLWRPVATTLHNPNDIPIRVTSLELSVTSDSFPPGCRAATNLEIQQAHLGASSGITVPAHGSVSLEIGRASCRERV